MKVWKRITPVSSSEKRRGEWASGKSKCAKIVKKRKKKRDLSGGMTEETLSLQMNLEREG